MKIPRDVSGRDLGKALGRLGYTLTREGFYSDSDLRRFNTYLANIQGYVAQENTIEQQRSELVQRNINKMKDVVK